MRKEVGQVGATMDDPSQASRLASITSYLLASGVPRMGVFKFSQVHPHSFEMPCPLALLPLQVRRNQQCPPSRSRGNAPSPQVCTGALQNLWTAHDTSLCSVQCWALVIDAAYHDPNVRKQ